MVLSLNMLEREEVRWCQQISGSLPGGEKSEKTEKKEAPKKGSGKGKSSKEENKENVGKGESQGAMVRAISEFCELNA